MRAPQAVKRPDFAEAEDYVHMMNPLMGGEFTLCGDAFDLHSDEEDYEQRPTARRTVTCPHCAKVILGCRRVRVAASATTDFNGE